MGKKKACEDKDYIAENDAIYKCKKCERLAEKEKKLCKPKKIEKS